jgi:esterase/lipase superfamily enzyme
MHREYHKWFSPRLCRDMELLVFGRGGTRVLVYPTRGGRFYDYENWGLVESLQPRIDAGKLQLYCVDSVDAESLYCTGIPPAARMRRHLQYENYILNEVLPFSQVKNPDSPLCAHGCSLGAYHATNIAFKHPHLFQKLLALSGRYDLTLALGPYRDLFDGYYDQAIYFNNPSHFLPRLADPVLLTDLRRLDIMLVIGEDDAFLENNHQLHLALTARQIPHRYSVWQGEAHRARYWRQMVALYL